MAYSVEVSRRNPTCFLFLVDQSASMNDRMPGDTTQSKADFVATAVNRILHELIIRCSKNMEIYRYFQVGVIGYGATVGPALPGNFTDQSLIWVDELYQNPLRIDEVTKKISDGAGGLVEVAVKFPVWFEPTANNGTPMVQAFHLAESILQEWLPTNPSAFPPIVINITDGESTDGDPSIIAERIKSLSTDDGNVLLLNLHVSSTAMRPLTFPDNPDSAFDQYAQLLFHMSSLLPQVMQDTANHHGYRITDNSRGFVFNAGLEDIIKFLDIGTRTTQASNDLQGVR
ncbi:MAG: VWA domain-containing protein [Caldilineaceae bacterium]|nr:VWA domain-containing protein [Caldilineaceae bacterium]